jgi:hypothetical protein
MITCPALVLLITAASLLPPPPPASAATESYVVYLGGHSHSHGAARASARRRSAHYALLGSVLRSEVRARAAIFYSYTRYINGFAATLEEHEAEQISSTYAFLKLLCRRRFVLLSISSTRFWFGFDPFCLGVKKKQSIRAWCPCSRTEATGCTRRGRGSSWGWRRRTAAG